VREPDLEPELERLVADGRTRDALRLYRRTTGHSVRDAFAAVEAERRRLRLAGLPIPSDSPDWPPIVRMGSIAILALLFSGAVTGLLWMLTQHVTR
jgi:hypothetical protein